MSTKQCVRNNRTNVIFCKKLSCLSVYIFTLVICININDVISESAEDEKYIIRNRGPNHLVLDATDSLAVKAELYNGLPQQQWKFKRANQPGLFYIIHAETGMALDIHGCNKIGCLLGLSGQGSSSPQQEWYINSNGKITNALRQENIDILGEKYKPGDTIGTWIDKDEDNQYFTLIKIT